MAWGPQRSKSGLKDRSACWEENQCNHCRLNLSYPKGIVRAANRLSNSRIGASGGQVPAHMVLMVICGKELWVPLDREIAGQMANILGPFRE